MVLEVSVVQAVAEDPDLVAAVVVDLEEAPEDPVDMVAVAHPKEAIKMP